MEDMDLEMEFSEILQKILQNIPKEDLEKIVII